jgi:cell division protein FtsZ
MPDPATLVFQVLAALVVVLLVLRLAVGRVSLRLRAGPGPAYRRDRRQGAETLSTRWSGGSGRRLHRLQHGCSGAGSLARRPGSRSATAPPAALSGSDPAIGRQAAEEDAARPPRSSIGQRCSSSPRAWWRHGLRRGAGRRGAGPRARRLTVAVVTLPFGFEGERRAGVAATAATELGATVDTMIALSNDRLHDVAADGASLLDAFAVVDGVLRQVVEAITELIAVPGLVNLDFADLRAVLTDGGPASFGVGRAGGDDRTVQAVRTALSSPLLVRGVASARSVLFHIAGPPNLRLAEVREAADEIRSAVDPGASVIFGATVDKRLRDDVRITVIATGLGAVPDAGHAGASAEAGGAAGGGSAGAPEPSGIGIDDLEVPTFIRSKGHQRRQPEQRSS